MQRIGWLAIVVLALVAWADYLFYEASLGWSAGLFLLALVAAMALRYRRAMRRPMTALLAAALVGLAAAMMIHPGALEIVLAVMLAAALPLTARHGWTHRVRDWTWRMTHAVTFSLAQPITDYIVTWRWRVRHGRRRLGLTGHLGRWIPPVLLAAVFVMLFRAANPIIEYWLGEAGQHVRHWIGNFTEYVPALRALLWLVTAWVVWSLMRMRLMVWLPSAQQVKGQVQSSLALGQDTPADEHEPAFRPAEQPMVVRSLVLFNLIFAVQLVLDVVYLWQDGQLPDGLTPAEYAHRGAYPLLASALLAGAFVIGAFRDGAPAEHSRAARALVFLWLAQNVWMLVSALRRLDLYVDVFSLTRLRVAAAIWMAVVALGLVWLIVRLARRRSNAWLIRVNVATAAMVCYACCFVNFDGAIAWFNVRHSRAIAGSRADAVQLDISYLRQLGYEAAPALRWYAQHSPNADLGRAAGKLADEFAVEIESHTADWRGWTSRRQRVHDELANMRQRKP